MASNDPADGSKRPRTGIDRRHVLRGAAAYGALTLGLSSTGALAETLSCLPVARMEPIPDTPPANKKIGVSVAYLKVPFYANFKTGLEDGAKQFGFTYDLVDGNSGDVATELANLQNLSRRNTTSSSSRPRVKALFPASSSSTMPASRSSRRTTRPASDAAK